MSYYLLLFLADLYDALLDTNSPHAWSNVANIVLFLDGFEALQGAASSTATRLLSALATKRRKEGKTDSLLIIVGSREYLPGSSRRGEVEPFPRTIIWSEQEVQRSVKTRYAQWQQRLPADTSFLRLHDLCLTFELQDFGQEDSRGYLLRLGEQRQTRVFVENDALVQTIDSLTHGHPLYLAMAAAAVLEANARGKQLRPGNFELAEVSPEIAPEHEDESIRDYLLDLFLRQLAETERKELFFCAIPRFLDAALLRVLLPKLDDIDRRKHWDYYQRLTFMRPADNERLVFHPLVRTLLLRQLPADPAPESDYYRIHDGLKNYFQILANRQRGTSSQEAAIGQARIEEAYHALALGDFGPAIELGITAQRGNLTLWEPLLEAVTQAPIELLPDDVAGQAYNALVRAMQNRDVQDVMKALILYTWFLRACESTPADWAATQNNLGIAYSDLPGGDRDANLRRAIAYYEAALRIFQLVRIDYYADKVKKNLEIVRDELRNLEQGEA